MSSYAKIAASSNSTRLDSIPSKKRERQSTFLFIFVLVALALIYSLSSPSSSTTEWIDSGASLRARTLPRISQQVFINYESQEYKCSNWNPELPEASDPVNCLRARQYRQVMRVLEREERGEHERWGFTDEHNIATLRSVSRCFLPLTHVNFTRCPEKPLIIGGWWYNAEAVVPGKASGESVWLKSLYKQLETFGMSIVAMGPYNNWVTAAEMMPDVYSFIWNDATDTVTCFNDPRCVAAEHYVPPENSTDLSTNVPDEERGVVPAWKLQILDFWGTQPNTISTNTYMWGAPPEGEWTFHPLGHEWIATPWALPSGHVHLPYSIEDQCLSVPKIQFEDRQDSALIFTKHSSYFQLGFAPPAEFWQKLKVDSNLDLILTAEIDEGSPLPTGLSTRGPQTVENYQKIVSNSKVVVGMGYPMMSPSVYTALCAGTPVVVPIFVDGEYSIEGWDLYAPWSQHGPAAVIGEPFVYTYRLNDYDSFRRAVEKASQTPIDRFIPDNMKMVNALPQMKVFLERNLEAMFDKVVAENGGIPRLAAGIWERRCQELKLCPEPLKAGRRSSA